MKYGKLTIIETYQKPVGNRTRKWAKCICDCGNTVDCYYNSLTSGNTTSCGCYSRELTIKENKERPQRQGKIKDAVKHPDYNLWFGMKARCYDPNMINYQNYGGRGITVCDRWLNSFTNFIKDMGDRPNRSYSIDRIDTNGNYEPSNCQWSTRKSQQRNRRHNHLVAAFGEVKCVAEWAEIKGMKVATLFNRLLTCKWDVEKALTTPVRKRTTLPKW